MFRPIYYLGCKTAFSAPIVDAINRVDPGGGHVCDLFSGTGAIGVALAASRRVTTVDVQEYSRVLCSAQLNPPGINQATAQEHAEHVASSPLFRQLRECVAPLVSFEESAIASSLDGDTADLVALVESPPLVIEGTEITNKRLDRARSAARTALVRAGLWSNANATVCSYFGGTYFSYRQSADLDAILSYSHASESIVKDTLLAAALSTASNLVNTVGKQFAQPIRPREKSGQIKKNLGNAVNRDRSLDAGQIYLDWMRRYSEILVTRHRHEALKMGFEEALEKRGRDFSVVYADPPYTRDHYSRFYHVLETMCLRDAPVISHVTRNSYSGPSRGAYRADRHQSPFCIRSEAPRALNDLCSQTRRLGLPLVLSYSPHEAGDGTHPRVMSASDIVCIAKQSFGRVDVQLLDGSTHNQLNRSDLVLTKRLHAEMIIECYP